MKIIMFQYNRDASAIVSESSMATEKKKNCRQLALNSFFANGYEDRLLWEEAASLRPKKPQPYAIPGTWQ